MHPRLPADARAPLLAANLFCHVSCHRWDGGKPSWSSIRPTNKLPGLASSHVCNSSPINEHTLRLWRVAAEGRPLTEEVTCSRKIGREGGVDVVTRTVSKVPPQDFQSRTPSMRLSVTAGEEGRLESAHREGDSGH